MVAVGALKDSTDRQGEGWGRVWASPVDRSMEGGSDRVSLGQAGGGELGWARINGKSWLL